MPVNFPLSRAWKPSRYEKIQKFALNLINRNSRVLSDIPDARKMPDLENIKIGSAKRMTVAVLFFDFKDFTNITSRISPEQTLMILNVTTSVVMRIVKEWGGAVEKHTGDGVMAVIGADKSENIDKAKSAIEIAMAIQYLMKNDIMPMLVSKGFPDLKFRIGIEMGEVLISRIGFHGNSFLTAVGSPANRASKAEGLARPNGIAIGENLALQLHKDLRQFLEKGDDPSWVWHYENSQKTYDYFHYSFEWCDPREWLEFLSKNVSGYIVKK